MSNSLCVGDNIRNAIPRLSTLSEGVRLFVDRESLGVLVSVEQVKDNESLLIQRGAFGYSLHVWKDVPCLVMQFTNEAAEGIEYRCTMNADTISGWRPSGRNVSKDEVGDGRSAEAAPFRRVMVYAVTTRGFVSVIRSVSVHRHHVERVFSALKRQDNRYERTESIREVEEALHKMSVDELIEKGGYYLMTGREAS